MGNDVIVVVVVLVFIGQRWCGDDGGVDLAWAPSWLVAVPVGGMVLVGVDVVVLIGVVFVVPLLRWCDGLCRPGSDQGRYHDRN